MRGMSFLQMSAAGALMILVITLLRAAAMNRVPKKTFLALWGITLLRLLVPFSLPSGLSIYSLLSRSPASAGAAVSVAALPRAAMQPVTHAVPRAAAASGGSVSLWGVLWMAGVVLCAVIFTVAYVRSYREFQMSLPVDNELTRRWLQVHALRRGISIRQSDRIASPLTFGVRHPVILMPKTTDWEDDAALQYVLEHEFVHIRRLDTAVKLLLTAAVCVHWFNPLVWLMYVLANRDLELSCDEAVIRHFGSGTRASYAMVLIRMEETRSGFAPLCNHFSKNVMEERITAIMKTKKLTIASLVLAVALVAGTTTVFATSAKEGQSVTTAASRGAQASEQTETAVSEQTPQAVESGTVLKPQAEYAAAGITAKNSAWYYKEQLIAGICDEDGGIYTNGAVENGVYLHMKRDGKNAISSVDVISRETFQELVDKHMNAVPAEVISEYETVMSYVNPDDGKTYYSFDEGKTFEPLTDEEYEALYPTYAVEWWTYDGYKAWLEQEKANLQDMLGEKGWTSTDGSFTWTQKKIDETIAEYEEILEDIKNGVLYSKTIDGEEDGGTMLSMNPVDIAISSETAEADTMD